MLDFLSSLLTHLFGAVLILVIVFLSSMVALSRVAPKDDALTTNDRMVISSVAAVVVLLFGLYLTLFGDEEPPQSAPTSTSTLPPAHSAQGSTAIPAGASTEKKTVYLQNYKQKGDQPIAIECEQQGPEVKCRPAK